MHSVLLTIAARGGSKSVKNKNVRDLCGLPLIAHTILQAKKWGKYAKLVCSTDSETIADIARSFGAEVPFMRPEALSTDTAGKLDVLRHALKSSEEVFGVEFQAVVDLDVTAPIRKVEDIDGAYNLFTERKAKTVFSVTPCRKNPYFNMVEMGKNGYAVISKDSELLTRRQDAPRVFDMNASIYVYDRDYLADENTMTPISDRSCLWVMDELAAVDIDNEVDFLFIEYLISKGMVKL